MDSVDPGRGKGLLGRGGRRETRDERRGPGGDEGEDGADEADDDDDMTEFETPSTAARVDEFQLSTTTSLGVNDP